MKSPAFARLQSPPIVLVLGLAWAVIVAQLLAERWAETAHTLSDMNDAMRLVQVRESLAGRGWFVWHMGSDECCDRIRSQCRPGALGSTACDAIAINFVAAVKLHG